MNKLFLVLLLLPGLALAETRQAEECGDGTTHQSGFCPAVLSSASCSQTGASTGSCSATSDESDGTRYVCATSTNTALTGAEIESCSGGAAVAGSSASETGSNSIGLTGLTTDAAHYGQIVNESPEGWYSNRLVSASFTPTGASSDNATRIDAILDNYTLPAAWGGSLEYPADPVITDTSTCASVTSATQFNNCADDAGTRITVTASFSGNIAITANDIDVVMDNAYTITGDLTMDTGSMVSRIRWTGGNVGAGNAQSWRPVSDVLFDDVVFFGRIDLDSRPTPGHSRRVAFINSTITTVGSSSGEDIDFTLETVSRSGISRHSDIIVANCLIENGNNSPTRFGWSERTVFVESYTHTTGVVTGFRFSSQSRDSFIAGRSGKPFIFIGRMHLSYDLFANDHAIHDATLDNVNGYIQYNTIGIDPGISGTNTGTVSNSTLYVDGAGGESMSTYPFSAGSGNTALTQAWDGSTLPSSSAYGAQR